MLKSKLQHVNSRIRCYEAALTRYGFDAASLLQLDVNQNQTSIRPPDAFSADGVPKSEDGAQLRAPESVAASTASVSVLSTEEGAAAAATRARGRGGPHASESKSAVSSPAAAASSNPVAQPAEMEMHAVSTTADTGANSVREAPEAA